MSTVAAATPGRPRAGRLLRTLSDERLVARVRSGDQAAFEVVYDRYHRQLLSFCRHMLGSREEAEDALQHTCISAYQVLQSDDRPIQLKAWLFTIARNRCLTMLRARREHADIADHEPAVDGLASEVRRRADLRELLADMRRLPEEQRAALVLSELGAHSHEEIAVILGVRKEKVKALVFQAREQLGGARAAREIDCMEIREQLATLRGGALRRTQLRRHVDTCPGCAAFRAEVQRQRAAMAVMLPVVPGVALKGSVLGAIFGGSGAASGLGGGGALVAGGSALGAAGAGGGGGLFAMIGAQGVAVKALAVLAVAGGAGGTGYVAAEQLSGSSESTTQSATPATRAVPATPGVTSATPAVRATPSRAALERRATPGAGTKARGEASTTARARADRAAKSRRASSTGRERAGVPKRSTEAGARSRGPSGSATRGGSARRGVTGVTKTGTQITRSRPARPRSKPRVTRRLGSRFRESTAPAGGSTSSTDTDKGRSSEER